MVEVDLEGVFPIGGEVVEDGRTASCAERRPFDVPQLILHFRNRVGHHRGRRGYITDCQAGNRLRGAHVALHQGRGDRQSVRHVVETTGNGVPRQEPRHIDFQVQKVPDGIPVFGPVHAVQLGNVDVRLDRRSRVQSVFQCRRKRVQVCRFRARRASRRHQTGTKLPDKLFGQFGVLIDVLQVQLGQTHVASQLDVVVAAGTVLLDQRRLGLQGRQRHARLSEGNRPESYRDR